jgi:hypothetical protein
LWSSYKHLPTFFLYFLWDAPDLNPQIYVRDSASTFVAGPFASGALVKIMSDPSATPGQKKIAGQVQALIILKGTPLLFAADADGNVSAPVPACTVP